MLLTEKDARTICEKLMSYVKADDAIVTVNSENYGHLRFAANAFTTSGARENVSVGVTAWIGGKRGSASTNEIDDESLKATVALAEQLARISPVDREYLPTIGQQTYKPVAGYAEATSNISLTSRAKTINDAIASCEKSKVIGAGFHQARGGAGASLTKNGNFIYDRSSLVSLGMTARTADGTSSGYFLRNHFDVTKLDTARIANEAIRKALDARNPRVLEPGVYPAILEPQAVADLVGQLAFSFDARSAEEGRSPFSAPGGKTKVGEKIFDERINVYSDPWHPELPGSKSAQGGLPAQKIYLVRNGVLENLVYSRYWAKQKSKEPTPGPVNSIIESSAPAVSVDDMIKSMDRGILLGRFWYIRGVDARTALQTGLTRDGIWYIENGKIQYAVKNFRFNQSVTALLAPGNIDMIGKPERVGNSEGQGGNAALLPALKVKEFHFSSQSEAV
ncbi:MAG TPA: TldD/PmbA family protein [Pyrinomonadaceae bacterium]|jgi:predicted Zn-dependent protease|nr:TldD/PmbA family protein [Pyrinomonadaceae bacterium]